MLAHIHISTPITFLSPSTSANPLLLCRQPPFYAHVFGFCDLVSYIRIVYWSMGGTLPMVTSLNSMFLLLPSTVKCI